MLKTKKTLISLATGISLLLLPGQSYAETYYMVKQGDSLWNISLAYNVTIDQIKSFNNLLSDTIYTGQKLLVSAAAPVEPSKKTNGGVPVGSSSAYYTVNPGDTLSGISVTYNTTVDKIKALNNLDTDIIYVGQKLLVGGNINSVNIPVGQGTKNTDGNVVNQPPTRSGVGLPGNSGSSGYYTVRPGDTLSGISAAYNITVDKIKALNNLNTDLIYVGQKLVVDKNITTNTPSKTNTPPKTTNIPPKKTEKQPVSRGTVRADVIIDYAKSFIGVPYVAGGESPSGFDCSGYLQYVFGHFNFDLPRIAADQYQMGQAVSSSQAKPGDFVAFKTGNYISHIGIYLGSGKFISATSSRGVIIDSLSASYWKDHFLGFSRVI